MINNHNWAGLNAIAFLWTARIALLLSACVLFLPSNSRAAKIETVSIPLTARYELLSSYVKASVFTDPGQTAVLLDEQGGQLKAVLSSPSFSSEKGSLIFTADVAASMHDSSFFSCEGPAEYKGRIKTRIAVLFNENTYTVSFSTIDSRLDDDEGLVAAQVIYRMLKETTHKRLDGISISLAPAITSFKETILPLFAPDKMEKAEQMIKSLRLGPFAVASKGLQAMILMDIEPEEGEPAPQSVEPLTPEEMEQFVESWEVFDDYFMEQISALSNAPLTADERLDLMDALIETRYEFVSELANPRPSDDFVRKQFVAVWKRVSDIYQTRLVEGPVDSMGKYITFFAASDALVTFDKLGKSFGASLSRDGLVRLARLFSDGKGPLFAPTENEVSPLRKTLGFDSISPAPAEPVDGKGQTGSPPLSWLLVSSAWASGNERGAPGRPADYMQWVHTKNRKAHVNKVRSLLADKADRITSSKGFPHNRKNFYRTLLQAVAWQESCFRQYDAIDGKIAPLLSYDKSSFGLMQVNRWVWRGFYDINRLKWDIGYNASAGAEILQNYLTRHALQRGDKKRVANDTILAQLTYAIYNGGPGELKTFFKRYDKGRLYSSDKLFLEKFRRLAKDDWSEAASCMD